jgi:chromosome segregation ATPase
MAEKVAEIERLRGVQRENKDRTDRLASDLAKKASDLQRAEERIEDLQAERQTVLADLEDFERDLNAQRAAARRLTEELQSLQDEQAATEGDKRKYAALQREHEMLVRQQDGMQARQREAEETKQEVARVVTEYKGVKAEMKVLEREIRLVREERGELEQWKSTHVCET